MSDQVLISTKGADVNIADHNGHTPLHLAVRNGNLNAVNALLSRQNVNVNLANKDGETPLHIASMNGRTDIASALIDKGAEVNAMDKDGETPLTYASRHNSAEAINILPEKGADLNVPDNEGETPLTYASQMGNLDTVKALVKSMGNYVKEIVGKAGKVAKSIFNPSIKNVLYILTGQFATNKTPKEDNVHPQGESEYNAPLKQTKKNF